YCPKSCGNSGCGPATTAPVAATKAPFVENANCKKWATNVNINFCGSAAIKDDQKSQICKTTCAAEIAKADDCALYTASATSIERFMPVKRTVNPGTLVVTNLRAATTITSAYVGPTCSLKLWNVDNAVPGTTAVIE
ncbi:hypothetical protein PFISCL1PPCAC_28201, partial [Pristionchus fissidentatus]